MLVFLIKRDLFSEHLLKKYKIHGRCTYLPYTQQRRFIQILPLLVKKSRFIMDLSTMTYQRVLEHKLTVLICRKSSVVCLLVWLVPWTARRINASVFQKTNQPTRISWIIQERILWFLGHKKNNGTRPNEPFQTTR